MSHQPNLEAMNTLKTIKGMVLNPPIIGRITLGHMEMQGEGDMRQAVACPDDSFNLTTLVQNKEDRSWEPHPILQSIKKDDQKLRAIPVVIAYNDPGLNLSNTYIAFDPLSGRASCSGDGDKAIRSEDGQRSSVTCPGAESCEFGIKNKCKSFTRAYFRIDGQNDELGNFVLRTTSWNSLDRLASRIKQLHALTGGKIAGMPMMLTMVDKTSRASYGDPFQFVDLVTRPGMSLIEAFEAASAHQEAIGDAGLNWEALEECLRQGKEQPQLDEVIEDFEEFLGDEELVGLAKSKVTAGPAGLRGLTLMNERLKGKVASASGTPDPEPHLPDPDNLDLLNLETPLQ